MAVFEGKFTHSATFRFAIIIGRFNDLVTSKVLAGCQDCLQRHGVDTSPNGSQVDYVWVPGGFEIPLVAKQLASAQCYDVIICIGAVIRGQTPHFDFVASEVSKGIASASMQTGIPIIFGILTVDSMQQALERAGIKSNKGWDFAMNALEMASLMHQIRPKLSGNQTFGESSALPPGSVELSSSPALQSEPNNH